MKRKTLLTYLDCDVLKFVFHQLSYKTNSNVNTSYRHCKNECARTFDLKVTLCYYYTELLLLSTAYDKQSIFSVKQHSIESGKCQKYCKVWIILEVNNDEVVVETWMARRSIADYINTSLHGFAYFVLHPSFKRPFFAGENSNLLHRFKISFDVLSREGGGFMKNVAVTFSVPKLIYELSL